MKVANRLKAAAGAIALALTLAIAPAAHSEGMTGNLLLQICTSKQPGFPPYCRGYILGLAEGLEIGAVGAADSQLQDIVAQWLRANPAERHHSGRKVVWAALSAAFP
jgi:hypothetical protein